MDAPVLLHSSEESYPVSTGNNTESHIGHLVLCTKTHRCWGASGDGRCEPLSQASDGLMREKSQFRQVTITEQERVFMSLTGQTTVFGTLFKQHINR